MNGAEIGQWRAAVSDMLAEGGETVTLLGEVIPAAGEHRVVYNGHLDLSW